MDGENVRSSPNSYLGFSSDDCEENIHRIGEVAKMMVDAGLIVITALIRLFQCAYNRVRALVPRGHFLVVYVECPLEICELNDPKGLSDNLHRNLIPEFTRIDSPYEPPLLPEQVHISEQKLFETCIDKLIYQMLDHQIIIKREDPLPIATLSIIYSSLK